MSDRTKYQDPEEIRKEQIFALARSRIDIDDRIFSDVPESLSSYIVIKELQSLFKSAVDELTGGNDERRSELNLQIREAVISIQLKEKERVQTNQCIIDEETRLIQSFQEVSVSVCSDAHLGRDDSKEYDFLSWLESRRPDETVVLLGDILDFWIYSQNDDQEDLITRIVAKWNKLWDRLNSLRQHNTKIYYVPGNHDAFVFFIEAADHFPWAKAIMDRSEDFQKIRDKTKGKRFSSVIDIVYPFLKLKLPIRNKQILFTHGHYVRWRWRQITGILEITEIDSSDIISFLTTASIVFAHKHARKFRKLVNEKDWFMRVQRIEDTAISITNAIVCAHEEARKNLVSNPEITLNIIDKAIELYFCGNAKISDEEELRIRDCLLTLSQLQGYNVPRDMQDVWDETMDFLNRACGESVHLDCSGKQTILHRTPFRDFQEPDCLMFGHYHKPRDQERMYDIGGFVDNCCTSLAIHKDGSITRPT